MTPGFSSCRFAVIFHLVAVMPEAIVLELKIPSYIGAGQDDSAEVRAPDSSAVQFPKASAGSAIHIRVRENGRLLVPVALNGKKECQFLFDTGATTHIVAEKLARRLGVTARSAERVHTFAREVSLSVGVVDRLTSVRTGLQALMC